VCDEVAALDDGDRVVPYAKPVALRPDSAALLAGSLPALALPAAVVEQDERFVAASTLGLMCAPAPVAAIVFPSFAAGRDTELHPLAPADALVRLMEHTLASGGSEPDRFRQLERLVRSVPAWHLEHGDARDAVTALNGLTGRRGRAAGPRTGRTR
jgi:hypothetical protein